MKKLFCLKNLSLFCLSASLLLSIQVSGQTSINKLLADLQKAENDSLKVIDYNRIFLYYQYSNPDSDIYYMKQGLSLFTTHKYKEGMAQTLANLGGLYSNLSMLDIAKRTGDDALKIYMEMNDKRGIANAQDILGVIEGRKSNYSEATDHFFIALKIYEEINDTDAITDTYIKLGAANENTNNHDKALDYYSRGLNLVNNKPVSDVTIFLNNNIGAVYVSKMDYPNGMKYLEKALEESDSPAYVQIHILPLENLGDLYCKMGDTAKALNYCQQALAIAIKENLPEDKANILITIADLKQKSDPGKALELLDSAFLTAKNIGAKSVQTEVLKSMIAIYKEKGNYKEAFSLLEEQKNLTDSILNIDKARTIANLETLYDLDKLNSKVQHLQLSEQKEQQKKNAIAIIAILLSLFLFILVFFLWKTKLLNTELYNREVKLNKASMIKNKLISIIAHDLIGSIRFMPLALGLCKDNAIPAEEKNTLLSQVELNAVASFETLQNMLDWGKAQIQGIVLNQSEFNVNETAADVLRFINIAAANKLITVKNNIAPGVMVYADANHFKFIIRNLLSNAIKYTRKQGVVEINATKSADASFVTFSIKDNGVGISDDIMPQLFEPFGSSIAGTDNEKGNGIGLNLCKEFVVENGGKIWVESEQNKGSVFYFSLKTQK